MATKIVFNRSMSGMSMTKSTVVDLCLLNFFYQVPPNGASTTEVGSMGSGVGELVGSCCHDRASALLFFDVG